MLSVPTKGMGVSEIHIYKSNTKSKLIESQYPIDIFTDFKGKMDGKELVSRVENSERESSHFFQHTYLQGLIELYSVNNKIFTYSTHQTKTTIVYSNEA